MDDSLSRSILQWRYPPWRWAQCSKLWIEYDARVLAEKIETEAAMAAAKAKALAEELKDQAALDAEAAKNAKPNWK